MPDLAAEVEVTGDLASARLARVRLGEPVDLTCAVRARFPGRAGGFDALYISTQAPPVLRRLRIGDRLIEVRPDSVEADDRGLTVFLPRRIEKDSECMGRPRRAGSRVPPGVYLCRVTATTGRGPFVVVRTAAAAF